MSDEPEARGSTVPEHLTVAITEIAGQLREGLLGSAPCS